MKAQFLKTTKKKLIIFVSIILIVVIAIVTSFLIINSRKSASSNKNFSNKSQATKPIAATYNYTYPATKLLNWYQKYTVNGLEYELASINSYGLTNSSSQCPSILTQAGCSHGIPVNEVDIKLTNVSGQALDYTSCYEPGSNCTNQEITNQNKVIQSLDFGCVAQITNGSGSKSYQTISQNKNVYSFGGFYGDYVFKSGIDSSELPVNDTLGSAITPQVNNGTGSYTLQPVQIKFNVGETKTAKIQVDSMQCLAVGAPDGSVFWSLPL